MIAAYATHNVRSGELSQASVNWALKKPPLDNHKSVMKRSLLARAHLTTLGRTFTLKVFAFLSRHGWQAQLQKQHAPCRCTL